MIEFERLPNRFITSCCGPDAANFLQGLITNDIGLGSLYTAMLTPRGRYLFDFFIYKAQHGYVLDCGSPALFEKLKFYLFSSQVEIEDVSSKFDLLYSRTALPIQLQLKDPRYKNMGFRALLAAGSNIDGSQSEGIYLADKYNYTMPDGDVDMIACKSFPTEFGLAHLNGISYSKGCYMGQELIAYLRGRPPVRRICKVTAESSLDGISQGSVLICGTRPIGSLCSARGNLGIALASQGASDCTLEGRRVSLSLAPWYSSNS